MIKSTSNLPIKITAKCNPNAGDCPSGPIETLVQLNKLTVIQGGKTLWEFCLGERFPTSFYNVSNSTVQPFSSKRINFEDPVKFLFLAPNYQMHNLSSNFPLRPLFYKTNKYDYTLSYVELEEVLVASTTIDNQEPTDLFLSGNRLIVGELFQPKLVKNSLYGSEDFTVSFLVEDLNNNQQFFMQLQIEENPTKILGRENLNDTYLLLPNDIDLVINSNEISYKETKEEDSIENIGLELEINENLTPIETYLLLNSGSDYPITILELRNVSKYPISYTLFYLNKDEILLSDQTIGINNSNCGCN